MDELTMKLMELTKTMERYRVAFGYLQRVIKKDIEHGYSGDSDIKVALELAGYDYEKPIKKDPSAGEQ